MDMSFAIQALSAKYLVDHRDTIIRKPGEMLNDVPAEIDREVANRKLADWGITIDRLSDEQHKYIYGE
jgi:adenosylhomocysteinase